VHKLLSKLRDHADTLPFFFCLGWEENLQQPAVLMISNLRVNPVTVRCHVLPPYNAPVNDFSWTVVAKPTELCNKLDSECDCHLAHAVNFLLINILEVAVQKTGRVYKSLFSKCQSLVNTIPDSKLYQLNTTTPVGKAVFDNYASKRLLYHNDFFMIESLDNILLPPV
jgi:hypothetical protein